MKTIIDYLKPYKLHIIVAYTLTFLELVADLIFPLLLAIVINEGIMLGNVNVITKWGIIMLIITFLTLLGGVINSFYASHISVQFAYEIRKDLFSHIQSFTFEQLEKFPSSSLVTRFTNDVRQVQNTVFMGLRIMARAPFLIIGSVIMALYVNIKISFIFIITVPLLLIFLYWVLMKGSTMFQRVQTYVDRVNRSIQETISGMRTIRSFVQYAFENNRFSKANKKLATQTKTAFRFLESSMPVLLFGMNVALLFIIWFGHKQVLAGSTNVGDVVAIINYALRTVMAISLLTFITLAFSRAKASIARIDLVINERIDTNVEPSMSNTSKHPFANINGKIKFDSVSFTYPNTEREILNNLNFAIESGEKIAIIGATGSGKTTLFQLIPRLYEPSKGTIYIDNQRITSYRVDALRKQISFVPQNPLLFTGTIRENITFGKADATDQEVYEAAIDAQIHETIMQFPDRYETRVGQRGINLSGGQKQRISIARALIRKPKILLFDDSTSSLDLQTERFLLEVLNDYDATTMMITQKISTARYADRILLLDAGNMIAFGQHEELMQTSPLYAEIVTSQREENTNAF